jgi:hypothetical protein
LWAFSVHFWPLEGEISSGGGGDGGGGSTETLDEIIERKFRSFAPTTWLLVLDDDGQGALRNVATGEVRADTKLPINGTFASTLWKRMRTEDGDDYFENVDGHFENYTLWTLPPNGREASPEELRTKEEHDAALAAAAREREAAAARAAVEAEERRRQQEADEVRAVLAQDEEDRRARAMAQEEEFRAAKEEAGLKKAAEAAASHPDAGHAITHPEAFSTYSPGEGPWRIINNPMHEVRHPRNT